MQTVDVQNIVASNINHIIICWFSEATHTFSRQRPTRLSHYFNVGLGAAQNCINPLQQAAERTALPFSQGPIDGCCSVSEEQHSVKGLGLAVRHCSHKWRLKRRVAAAKISWLEPIKACLTFVFLPTKRSVLNLTTLLELPMNMICVYNGSCQSDIGLLLWKVVFVILQRIRKIAVANPKCCIYTKSNN